MDRWARAAGSATLAAIRMTPRTLLVCLALGLSGCCSAAAGAAVAGAGVGPTVSLAAVTNNGGAGGGAGGGGGGVAPAGAGGPVTLWCAQPGGTACSAAAGLLGTAPADAAAIPEAMLGPMRDGADDCADPDVSRVTALLQGPLGITPGNWHDNVGSSITRGSIAQTFSGGGCTNCCFAPTQPAVKVHVVDGPTGARTLVRVWEVGSF